MGQIVLVLGGVRSGKSRFAQELAWQLAGERVLYVATAAAGDDEMARRIAIHRRSRPAAWTTLEATSDVGEALSRVEQGPPVVLLDCLTLLVSNVLLARGEQPEPEAAEERVRREIDGLVARCAAREGTAILVSGEVGMGLVPEHPLGRLYRDLLGWSNQSVAERAQATYLMVAGLAVNLKTLALSPSQAAQMLDTCP